MATEDQFIIIQTTDTKKIAACAMMMAATDPWITYEMDYDQCLKAFDGACKEIYVLENENGIAGFAILQICGTFKGYIQSLCISEIHRNKGMGKKLLQFCEGRILKISPNIFICVSSFNEGAIKLYYEFGFKLIGELNDFLKEGFSELLLRKTFGPTAGYSATDPNSKK
jgi:ribosomal-protein-alanine N-acetyltransferase